MNRKIFSQKLSMTIKTLALSVVFSAICDNCLANSGSSSTSNLDSLQSYAPFKKNDSDRWGLIDANGKILIEDEYFHQPSNVVNEMFFVPVNNSYELYNISNLKKWVDDGFVSIAYFTEDYAPSVKRGEGIKYINKEGKVMLELDKYGKYKVAEAFRNGYSKIYKGRECDELVSKDLKLVSFKKFYVQKVLSNDKFLAEKKQVLSNDKFLAEILPEKDDKYKYYIIDLNENILESFTGYRICQVSEDAKLYIYQNKIDIYNEYGGYEGIKYEYGLRTTKGEDVVKPGKYDYIEFADNNYLLVRDKDRLGVIDINGNEIIRPKYINLRIKDDKLIARKDVMEGFGLIDLGENRVFKFDNIEMFFFPNSNNIIRQKNDKIELIEPNGDIICTFNQLGGGILDLVIFQLSGIDFDRNVIIPTCVVVSDK